MSRRATTRPSVWVVDVCHTTPTVWADQADALAHAAAIAQDQYDLDFSDAEIVQIGNDIDGRQLEYANWDHPDGYVTVQRTNLIGRP